VSRCLVLGGAGFLGARVARALRAAGHAVRVFDRPHLDRLHEVIRATRAELATGDFLNTGDLERALVDVEAVFHFVATTLPAASNANPLYDAETNLVGTLRLLELCRRARVQRVLFPSSGGTVYGVPRALPIAEDHPTEPTCAYGIHKLAIEKYLRLAHLRDGLEYVVLRLSNPFGEGQRTDTGQGAVTVFLHRALRGEPIEIWGDGSVVRDYVYVGDVAEAFVAALAHRGEPRLFNIGSGRGTSLVELVREVETVLGRAVAVRHLPGRAFDVPSNVLDCTRARAVLGWRARTPLREGIRRTLEWLREHG